MSCLKRIVFVLLFIMITPAYADKIILLKVDSPISPAVEDYIIRGLDDAKKEQASLLIIKLNTPGGIESSMRGINSAIINSPVPVLTWVAPQGARAASAGTFIMYASHFNAMAPGTNIGAASPVELFGDSASQTTKSVEKLKSMNDAAAYIRSLAQLRGRNVQWAEEAVKHAVSLSANEAKKLNVIDIIAANEQDLLQQLNGHKTTVLGKTITFSYAQPTIEVKMADWRYQFLAFLTNPNIAYILMLIAMYGLFFELANPGAVLPGVAGVIALLLVLYAFQLLPVNYAGVALILIGLTFMLFEVYVASFGVIGIGGIIAFIIGSIMLFDWNDPNFQVMWQLILVMSLLTSIFFFFMITLAVRSHKKAVITGSEGIIGHQGTVLSIMNEQIVVRVGGEIWSAKSAKPLEIGDRIYVDSVEGLTLIVSPEKRKQK